MSYIISIIILLITTVVSNNNITKSENITNDNIKNDINIIISLNNLEKIKKYISRERNFTGNEIKLYNNIKNTKIKELINDIQILFIQKFDKYIRNNKLIKGINKDINNQVLLKTNNTQIYNNIKNKYKNIVTKYYNNYFNKAVLFNINSYNLKIYNTTEITLKIIKTIYKHYDNKLKDKINDIIFIVDEAENVLTKFGKYCDKIDTNSKYKCLYKLLNYANNINNYEISVLKNNKTFSTNNSIAYLNNIVHDNLYNLNTTKNISNLIIQEINKEIDYTSNNINKTQKIIKNIKKIKLNKVAEDVISNKLNIISNNK